jgi:2-polyprenyl-3-methyl-5-hydroxy-6-metoxy-1,4-benzoquinol methylase
MARCSLGTMDNADFLAENIAPMSKEEVPVNKPDTEPTDRYSSYLEWKNWDKHRFGQSSGEDQAYFRKLIELAGPLSGKDVCEIGFGNGALLAYLGTMGYRVFGVELQEELVQRASKHGAMAVGDIGHFPDDLRFDLVFLVDVIEHVGQERIPEFLASIKARLKPNGKIVARFPNGDSPFGLKNQNGDVTHVTVIGSKKIGYFARRAGLSIVYLGAEPLPVAGGSFSKQVKKAVSIPLRHIVRKLLTTFLTLPMDKSFFSQNLVAILANPASTDRD